MDIDTRSRLIFEGARVIRDANPSMGWFDCVIKSLQIIKANREKEK
jgi:hypothetical protein